MSRCLFVMTFVGRMKEGLAQMNGNFNDLKDSLVFLDSRLSKRGFRAGKKVQAAKPCQSGSMSEM